MAPENSSNYGYGITIADVVTIIAAIHFSSSHSGIEVDDFGKFAMVFVCIDALASIFTAFSALLYSKNAAILQVRSFSRSSYRHSFIT